MITVQKEVPQFQWITKSRAYSRSDFDVTIGVGTTNGKPRASITMRNKQYEHFPSEHLMFGIDGDRLFFCDADRTTGYKLCACGDFSRVVQCGDETLYNWAKLHLGDYRLDKDAKSGLYYIDATRR